MPLQRRDLRVDQRAYLPEQRGIAQRLGEDADPAAERSAAGAAKAGARRAQAVELYELDGLSASLYDGIVELVLRSRAPGLRSHAGAPALLC